MNKLVASIWKKIAYAFEWSPTSKSVAISHDRRHIFNIFQVYIFYINLQFLYGIYSITSGCYLIMFFLNHFVHQLTPPSKFARAQVVLGLILFNIFYHLFLFLALYKIKGLKKRISKIVFLLNGLSQVMLPQMLFAYGMHFNLAQTKTETVIFSVLFISMNTYYFQNSFLASIFFWTLSLLAVVAESLHYFSTDDNSSYFATVRC